MNLQSMSIIFVIIFLPIILISTYYIQREVDTITMQNSYDTKLIDATTDAVSAFEINTANEDLSSVSDSLRSIIEASNNVFTTTLASNLGMSGASKSRILPYIPAVVYTLYDGYYIYSPSQQPVVLTDPYGVYVKVGDPGVTYSGSSDVYSYDYTAVENCKNDATELANLSTTSYDNLGSNKREYGKILYIQNDNNKSDIKCTINSNDAKYSTNYILKSFIPYTAQYVDKNSNYITINYTLDNFITVYIKENNGKYYTKSGYLVDTDKYSSIPNEIMNDDIALNDIEQWVDKQIEDKKPISIEYDGISISTDDLSAKSINYKGDEVQDNISAIKYYLKAYSFSKWFLNSYGKELNEDDILYDNSGSFSNSGDTRIGIAQSGEKLEEKEELFYKYQNKAIFSSIADTDSSFYEHKRNVIKNSIQYNLNLAMAIYNAGQGDEYYQMPILSEVEWDKILSNISIVSFMQGLPCGLKTYNNYAIVTSTNNEIMSNINDIYFVGCNGEKDEVLTTKDLDNKKNEYYTNALNSITTDDLSDEEKKARAQKMAEEKLNQEYISSANLPEAHHIDCKEINNDYNYYQSFSSKELKYDKVYNSNTRKYEYDHVCNSCYYCIINSNYTKQTLNDTLKRAKLIAIGKIKNNTYKTSQLETNEGIEIISSSIEPKKVGNQMIYDLGDLSVYSEILVTIQNKIKTSSFPNYISKTTTNDVYLENYADNKFPFAIYNSNESTTTYRFGNDNGKWESNERLVMEFNKNLTTQNIDEINESDVPIVSITYKYK